MVGAMSESLPYLPSPLFLALFGELPSPQRPSAPPLSSLVPKVLRKQSKSAKSPSVGNGEKSADEACTDLTRRQAIGDFPRSTPWNRENFFSPAVVTQEEKRRKSDPH